MTRTLHTFTAAVLLLGSLGAQASELDLNLAEDVFRGTFITAVDPQGRDGGSVLDFGALFMEGEPGDAILAHASLLVFGDAGAAKANVQAGIGARAVLLDADPTIRGMALSLGGTISARVPEVDRLGVTAWGFFAPDVTAFEDLQRYFEYGASIDYQLIRRAVVYVGFRQIDVRYGRVDSELDSGVNAGVRLNF